MQYVFSFGGWVVAALVAIGWWLDRRGANGVCADLNKQIAALRNRVK